MDKSQLNKTLDEIIENYRKDMALFENGSNKTATLEDLNRLSTMTFYAISIFGKSDKGFYRLILPRPQLLAGVTFYRRRKHPYIPLQTFLSMFRSCDQLLTFL